MPTDTPNHGYNRPDQGTVDWHLPLNENFGLLDVDVEVRDTETNILNNRTPAQGAKALATDTGAVFLGDGNQWNQFGVIPTESQLDGGSALIYEQVPVSRTDTVQVPTTGDEIQQAIDDAVAGNGSRIIQLLPDVVYQPSSTIELKGQVQIRGWAPSDFRKFPFGSTISGINIPDGNFIIRFRSIDETNTANNSSIQNVVINGHRGDGKSLSGIEQRNIAHTVLKNVEVRNCFGHGYFAPAALSVGLPYVVVSECGNAANGVPGVECSGLEVGGAFKRTTIIGAISVDNGPSSDAVLIRMDTGSTAKLFSRPNRLGLRAQSSDQPGIELVGGNLIARGLILTTNNAVGGPGILLDGGSTGTFIDCNIEKWDPNVEVSQGRLNLRKCNVNNANNITNGGHGILLQDTNSARRVKLVSVHVFDNQGDGIVAPRGAWRLWYDIRCNQNGGVGIRGNPVIVGYVHDRNGAGPFDGSPKFFAHDTKNTPGWVNRADGQASVADGDLIPHGLDETPEYVQVESMSSNHAYPAAVDAADITVGLEDPSGAAVGTTETVFWKAVGPTALLR